MKCLNFPGSYAMDDRSEIDQLRECKSRKEKEKLLADLFTRHRDRLRSMVDLRLHPRLRARIDPSDVLQEAFLDAARMLAAYLRDPRLPIFLWLRRVTADKLHDLHRHHLDVQARDARRETPLAQAMIGPQATSTVLATELVKESPSPSETASREDRKASLEAALESMEPIDREIIALRSFEKLSGKETAQVLGIEAAAARQRYYRALRRLEEILGKQWGGRKERD